MSSIRIGYGSFVLLRKFLSIFFERLDLLEITIVHIENVTELTENIEESCPITDKENKYLNGFLHEKIFCKSREFSWKQLSSVAIPISVLKAMVLVFCFSYI